MNMTYEALKALVSQNRSYRRFDGTRAVTGEEMEQMIDLCRLSPSGANHQALRFRPVTDRDECAKVYATLKWAAALPDWDGPIPEERPRGYVIFLCDKSVAQTKPYDVGIMGQSLLLGAASLGLGGCMLLSVDRPALSRALEINTEKYAVELVIALGRPVEEVSIVPLEEGGDVRYYRDGEGHHFVPKRALSDLIVDGK